MFHYLSGLVAELYPNLAVIDCGGVGFEINTSAYTLSMLKAGEKAKLYTYVHIREDAFDIFGFASREEQNCFKLLLGVTSVGPKVALAILSVLPPDRLTLAVMTGDEKALAAANGVGKKVAQRIILELRDKIGSSVQTLDFSGGAAGVEGIKVILLDANGDPVSDVLSDITGSDGLFTVKHRDAVVAYDAFFN